MKASAGTAATPRRDAPGSVTAKAAGKPVAAKQAAPATAKTTPVRAKAAAVAPARRTEPDEIVAATPAPAAAKMKPAATAPEPSVAPSPVAPSPVAPGPMDVAATREPPAPPPPGAVAPVAARREAEASGSGAAVPAPPASHASHYQMGPDRRALPRPMAAAETFIEGDHVVYPTHGVGRVERIAMEEIAGHKLELIHITFEENRMTLRVPVAKARTAGLRKLASRDLFDKALDVLRGRARIKRTMWSRRAQEYEAKINSGDPLAIAEVVRDLHRNAGQPDQSFSERQIYESAMDRLGAELAALDQTDKATAATKLAEFLKTV